MSRLTALILVVVLWAAIYLPGLGSTELKGEEGRRILPAVTMLETGNWLVPYVGGKPFLRKPPLMNWLIAGSFQLTGVRNEWTARLPSVLAVLGLGLVIVGTAGPGWLRAETALNAALIAISAFGLLAKARFAGAEIEGVYAPLFGIAITLWLAAWTRGWSAWAVWLTPAVFLGLAALAKGPLHLLFFYAVVIAVLWSERRLKALLHPAHLLSLLVIVGMFAAWAVPYFHTEAASKATKVWRDQMANRVTENHFEWSSYLTNLPRGLGDLLPWVLFAPLVVKWWRRTGAPHVDGEVSPRVVRAVLVGAGAVFLVLLLVPGILPRYVLPLGAPLAIVVAVALSGQHIARWPVRIATIMGLGFIAFAIVAVPVIRKHDDLRPLAEKIDAATPAGARLTLYDPGYQAWIFYLRSPYGYAPYLEDIPANAAAVVSRGGEKQKRKFLESRPDLEPRATFKDKTGAEFILYVPKAAQG